MSVVLAVYCRHCSDAYFICWSVRPVAYPYLVDLVGPMGHGNRRGRCELVVPAARTTGVPFRVLPWCEVSPDRVQLE
jgi:hypothetical protein